MTLFPYTTLFRSLEKQNEALGMTSSNIGELFKATAETIGTAAETFKTLSDLM